MIGVVSIASHGKLPSPPNPITRIPSFTGRNKPMFVNNNTQLASKGAPIFRWLFGGSSYPKQGKWKRCCVPRRRLQHRHRAAGVPIPTLQYLLVVCTLQIWNIIQNPFVLVRIKRNHHIQYDKFWIILRWFQEQKESGSSELCRFFREIWNAEKKWLYGFSLRLYISWVTN